MTDRTGSTGAEKPLGCRSCPYSLSRIFNHQQIICPAYTGYIVVPAHASEQMHGHNAACTL